MYHIVGTACNDFLFRFFFATLLKMVFTIKDRNICCMIFVNSVKIKHFTQSGVDFLDSRMTLRI